MPESPNHSGNISDVYAKHIDARDWQKPAKPTIQPAPITRAAVEDAVRKVLREAGLTPKNIKVDKIKQMYEGIPEDERLGFLANILIDCGFTESDWEAELMAKAAIAGFKLYYAE